MFPFIVSCHDVPSFAVKGEELTNYKAQEEEPEDSCMHISALLLCCPVRSHRKQVEGDIFEQGFVETFKSEFGTQCAQ